MKSEDALALIDLMTLQAVHEPPPVPAEAAARRYVEVIDRLGQPSD